MKREKIIEILVMSLTFIVITIIGFAITAGILDNVNDRYNSVENSIDSLQKENEKFNYIIPLLCQHHEFEYHADLVSNNQKFYKVCKLCGKTISLNEDEYIKDNKIIVTNMIFDKKQQLMKELVYWIDKYNSVNSLSIYEIERIKKELNHE